MKDINFLDDLFIINNKTNTTINNNKTNTTINNNNTNNNNTNKNNTNKNKPIDFYNMFTNTDDSSFYHFTNIFDDNSNIIGSKANNKKEVTKLTNKESGIINSDFDNWLNSSRIYNTDNTNINNILNNTDILNSTNILNNNILYNNNNNNILYNNIVYNNINNKLNPKQIEYIERRKNKREWLNKFMIQTNNKYTHESRHKHAMNRLRAPSGRFLTKKETEALYLSKKDI